MGGNILYDFGGLITAPGLLMRNPASCVDCLNVSFPVPGVMRKRRGFLKRNVAPGLSTITTFSVMTSKDIEDVLIYGTLDGTNQGLVLIRTAAALTSFASTLSFGNSGYAELAVLGAGHYVASNMVVRIESDFASYEAAGMPRGLAPITYSMNAAVYSVLTGAPGTVLADGSNVAYRVTWHKYDYSKNYILGGPPSSRIVVRNISGTSGYAAGVTKNIFFRIPLPFVQDSISTKVNASYFWRLWRSRTSTGDTADDEMYLVDEAYVTAADITAGYVTVTDATPDVLLLAQPVLNTNSVNNKEAGKENGQAFADEAPPAANHVAVYQDCVFYGDCTWRAYRAMKMFALPAVNDTLAITFNSVTVTLTCVAGAPAGTGQYTLVNGLASLSLNIEATCRNMVDAYTRAATNGCKAMYLSQGTQDPGLIAFEAATMSNQSFVATLNLKASSAGAGAIFRPAVSSAVAGEDVSPVRKTNVLCFSKPGRGDAVPPINQLTVGPAAASILKIIPFRERMLVFTNAGVFEVSGTDYSNFGVSILDATLTLAAPKTVVALEDRVYAWCREGIAEFSDGGRIVISASIEPTVTAIEHAAASATGRYDFMASTFFAVASPKTHVVRFFYRVGSDSEAGSNNWLEFDARARKWSFGGLSPSVDIRFPCGIARYSDGAMVMGSTFSESFGSQTFVERDTDAAADFADQDSFGTDYAVQSSATFQFQVPEVDARQHWQQMVAEFEDGEQTFYPKPTSVNIYWQTDTSALSSITIIALSAPLIRVETPTAYRRSTRQRVKFTHTLAEHFGLIGLKQAFANNSKSRFPK